MSLARKVSRALVEHAKAAMPGGRASWARGMANELDHIVGDGAALRWAIGGVMTAYLELASACFGSAPVRFLLLLPLLFEAVQAVFAQTMTLAWREGATGLLGVLGSQTPGDDYHRFIPLLRLVPDWYLAAGFLSGLLVLASALQLIRRRPSAAVLFLAGIAAGMAAETLVHRNPAFNEAARQVFEFKDTRTMRDTAIPVGTMAMPIVIATSMWMATRGARRLKDSSS